MKELLVHFVVGLLITSVNSYGKLLLPISFQ